MEREPESVDGPVDTPPQREKYSYPAAGAGGTDPPALHAARGVPRTPRTLQVGVLLLAAGGWLMLAPSALSYPATVATISDMITGFLLAVVALAALVAPARMRWLGLVAALLGAWVLAAPFVLFYAARPAGTDAIWNDLVVGAVVLVLGVLGALTQRRV